MLYVEGETDQMTEHRIDSRLIVSGVLCGGAAIAIVLWVQSRLPVPGQLHEFAQVGDVQGVREAISKGADPNETIVVGHPPKIPGVTPAMFAAKAGNVDCLAALLEAGAKIDAVNELGESALHYGVNHPVVVSLLIEHGADIDLRTKSGRTPLVLAARIGRIQSIDELLQAGAQVDGPFSPIAEAAGAGHVETLQAILDYRSLDDGTRESHLSEAILAAAARGHGDCIQVLLAAGVRVDSRGVSGETALMRASESAPAPVVQMLLKAGADPMLTDKMGLSALDYARRRKDGQKEAVERLLTPGG